MAAIILTLELVSSSLEHDDMIKQPCCLKARKICMFLPKHMDIRLPERGVSVRVKRVCALWWAAELNVAMPLV